MPALPPPSAHIVSIKPPARIVSINLCADQYLLALADRRQIAAVTVYAADPGMSAAASEARGMPATRATAEELLTLAPDLVFAAPYQVAAKRALLPGTRVVAVPEATGEPAIETNIALVAAAVGHPERGRAVIGTMRAELAAESPPPASGRRIHTSQIRDEQIVSGEPVLSPATPAASSVVQSGRLVAAQYQRGGYLSGTGTLVDDLMRRAGLTNLAAVLHRPPLSRLSLEEIIAAKPDYLIIERRAGRPGDRGAAMLDHPALARAFPPAKRLTIDAAWTVCGGPAYPRAVAALRAQVAKARTVLATRAIKPAG